VESNPINRVDRSGYYWWGAGQALWEASEMRFQNQNIHVRIQALWMAGRMDQVHAEYPIPIAPYLPVDLLDSLSGEIWEIKPWADQGLAPIDIEARRLGLELARDLYLLDGMNPVALRYDWNEPPPPVWIEGYSFPRELYIGTDDTGYYDFYAGQTAQGVIAWWKYKRPDQRIPVVPIFVPDEVKYSRRNERPGWRPNQELAPAYSRTADWNVAACTTVIIAAGGTIIIIIDMIPGDEFLIPGLWAPVFLR
jgi:hypothetical protein